jgi:hypothetical protein
MSPFGRRPIFIATPVAGVPWCDSQPMFGSRWANGYQTLSGLYQDGPPLRGDVARDTGHVPTDKLWQTFGQDPSLYDRWTPSTKATLEAADDRPATPGHGG